MTNRFAKNPPFFPRAVAAIAAGLLVAGPRNASADPAPAGAICSVFERSAGAVVKIYGPRAGREHGYGTGVVVSSDGKIVTTLSLLVSMRGVQVVLDDGQRRNARLVQSDEGRQLALLQIDAQGLDYLTPGESAHLQQGDTVVAIGNWFKIAEGDERASINRGILSLRTTLQAKRLAQEFVYAGPVLVYDGITANPGASGGPLLDLDGRFVGLIGKIAESVNTNTRINYAIPGEEIIAFLGQTSQPETSDRRRDERPATSHGKPYLGIKLAGLGYRHVSAFVERVQPDSPAAEAGVRPDDLILAIGNSRVSDADEYQKLVARLIPGERVSFVVKRGEELIALELEVASKP